MSRKTPIEKIADAAAASVREGIISDFEDGQIGASPIEHIFFSALRAYVRYVGGCSDDMRLLMSKTGSPLSDVPATNEKLKDYGDFCVLPVWVGLQTPMGSYRADFTFTVQSWKDEAWRTLVVECDGHDFHERTKEQASRDRARDRWMAEQGYTVFRFTGSELYRDPMKCAEQVFEMLFALNRAGEVRT